MKDFFLPMRSDTMPERKAKAAIPQGAAAFIIPISAVPMPIFRRYILNTTKKVLKPAAAKKLLAIYNRAFFFDVLELFYV